MSDAQNVPVFVSSEAIAVPRFLGRFRLDELPALVEKFADEGCFDGEDRQSTVETQFVCSRYNGEWITGYHLFVCNDAG